MDQLNLFTINENKNKNNKKNAQTKHHKKIYTHFSNLECMDESYHLVKYINSDVTNGKNKEMLL